VPDRPSRILLVDDEHTVLTLLSYPLRQEGYEVVQASDGLQALSRFEESAFDLVVLDVMMPKLDGLEVCRRLRAKSSVPIIMLTAKSEEIDKVLGLELGADDYIGKPFSPREMVARVKAVLRRTSTGNGAKRDPAEVLAVGSLEVDPARREVRSGETAVELTAREFDLLAHFAANQGLVYTRQQLLDAVWGPGWYGDERTVDVHVRQLRKKLGDALPLKTVWGVGYRCG
jgi:DNA-binding response OmpR family regulator